MNKVESEMADDFYVDREEPKDNKYETFVAGVLKDFDSRVQAIQMSAEVNMSEYESYLFELKRQLEICQLENDELRKKLRTALSAAETFHTHVPHGQVEDDDSASLKDINNLLQCMTCLSVKTLSVDLEKRHYQCQVCDGLLNGMCFSLTLNQISWEYTYEPQATSAATQLLKKSCTPELATSIVFPDYMLSRFLANLLDVNYGKLPTEQHEYQ